MQSSPSFDALVDEARRLETTQLESLFEQVRMIRAERRAPHASQQETELLRLINRSLAETEQQRFDALVAKRWDGTLSETEHEELLQLVEKTEQLDVERINYLTQLAQLRGVGLRPLMAQLGILPPPSSFNPTI